MTMTATVVGPARAKPGALCVYRVFLLGSTELVVCDGWSAAGISKVPHPPFYPSHLPSPLSLPHTGRLPASAPLMDLVTAWPAGSVSKAP